MRTPAPQHLTLKALFRDLLTACGGLKRCAALLGHPDSHLSASAAAHVTDRWPRLDHVIDLEADCGQPIVTQFLADRHGMDLMPRTGTAPAASTVQHLSKLARETGEVIAQMAAAVADGEVSNSERAAIVREIQQMIDAGHAAMADLRAEPRGKR